MNKKYPMRGDRLDKQLHIIYFNARSLSPKIDELRIVCELEKPDIVCITETWLCDDITTLGCSISGYHCVICDRHRHGGGVAMFISDNLESHVLLCGANNLELLVVSVYNSNNAKQKVHIGLWYRLPDNSVALDNRYF